MLYQSTCCECGEWHPHTKSEHHLQADDYHLIAWDINNSCGWAIYYGRIMFEGTASNMAFAKEHAKKAVELHQDLMYKLQVLGLRRTGWEG